MPERLSTGAGTGLDETSRLDSHHGLHDLRPGMSLQTLTERLAYGVLVDAIALCRGWRSNGGRDAKDRREAEQWFARDTEDPWTFCWVCEVLKLDPGAVRRGLATPSTEKPYGCVPG